MSWISRFLVARPGLRGLVLGLGALLLLSGCGHQSLRVQVAIAPDANGSAPVILSILFVKNPALLQKVMELSARQWFTKRDQLLRDHRRELSESYYEFVPGQQVAPLELKVGRGIGQGVLFVNYGGAIPHRYVFDTARAVQMSFGPRSVTLAP